MKLKKYTQFLTENIVSNEITNDSDNIWIITDGDKPIEGYSSLEEAIKEGILDEIENGDEWDMEEDLNDCLSNYGYGENYKEMEQYDQDVLDVFLSNLIQKYSPSLKNLRVMKNIK